MIKGWKVGLLSAMFFILITFNWRIYEVLKFGEIRPDVFDTIIALILSISLTLNFTLYRDLVNKETDNQFARKVLEWYGDQRNYGIGRFTDLDASGNLTDWESRIQKDAGLTARKALTYLEGGRGD